MITYTITVNNFQDKRKNPLPQYTIILNNYKFSYNASRISNGNKNVDVKLTEHNSKWTMQNEKIAIK